MFGRADIPYYHYIHSRCQHFTTFGNMLSTIIYLHNVIYQGFLEPIIIYISKSILLELGHLFSTFGNIFLLPVIFSAYLDQCHIFSFCLGLYYWIYFVYVYSLLYITLLFIHLLVNLCTTWCRPPLYLLI